MKPVPEDARHQYRMREEDFDRLHEMIDNDGHGDGDLAAFMGEARRARRSESALQEALGAVTDLLNDPGVGDIDQWKRDCREWTRKARALLAKAEGK